MVNSRLRSRWPEFGTFAPGSNRFERNFATNAALTNQIIGIVPSRSRFGPADSWVIKIAGTAAFAVGR
jgi:hypothetical protein